MTDLILTQTADDNAEGMAWLSGEGDSMSADFNHGDPLLVDTNVNSYVGDGIYVFQVGSDRFVKRLQRVPEGFAVLSSNPGYYTWYITPDMSLRVFGRVIKAWKSSDI